MAPAPRFAIRAAAAWCTAALVLVLTHRAPAYFFQGERGALFNWLGYVTLITAALPGAVMLLGLRQSLAGSGLAWGRSRRDAVWIALALLGALAAAWVVSRAPEMRAFYPRHRFVKAEPLLWLPSTLGFAAYGLAWEMMFRGYLVVGLTCDPDTATPAERRRNWIIVCIQTALFTLAHLQKPALEAWLSLPAGLFFGWAALRTRSVLPGFLLHFTLSTSINLFCAYA